MVVKFMVDAVNELRNVICSYKNKPYLPFWGEIYLVLQKIKNQINKNTKSDVFLYEINNSAQVIYQPQHNKYCIRLPEINIFLSQDELIDNILRGRFWPR
jgi:ABC-type microcin C transport system permease subunit YejE